MNLLSPWWMYVLVWFLCYLFLLLITTRNSVFTFRQYYEFSFWGTINHYLIGYKLVSGPLCSIFWSYFRFVFSYVLSTHFSPKVARFVSWHPDKIIKSTYWKLNDPNFQFPAISTSCKSLWHVSKPEKIHLLILCVIAIQASN